MTNKFHNIVFFFLKHYSIIWLVMFIVIGLFLFLGIAYFPAFLGIPFMCFCFGYYFIFLRSKFLVLNIESLRSLFLWSVVILLFTSCLSFASFLSEYFAKTIEINSVNELYQKENASYYKINKFYIKSAIIGEYKHHYHSRRKEKYEYYLVSPMVDLKDSNKVTDYKVWYGKQYDKSLGGIFIDKEQAAKKFYIESESEYNNSDFYASNIFMRHSDKYYANNYYNAASNTKLASKGELIIISPMKGNLNDRFKPNLYAFMITTFIGIVLILFWARKVSNNSILKT